MTEGATKDLESSLIAERARLILPKLIKYMERKESQFTKSAKQSHKSKTYDGGAGKMALATYDDLIVTRAVVGAILKGEANWSTMRILGLADTEQIPLE